MRKTCWMALIAWAISITGPAAAAEPSGWSGFYVGVEAGPGWGRSQLINADPSRRTGLPFSDPFSIGGGLLGGIGGYNVQFGRWIVGVEGDMSWSRLRGAAHEISPFNTTFTNTTTANWLGTGRVRAGYSPTDAWLIYATGGFAGANLAATVGNVPGDYSRTQTDWGWALGGGVEAALSRNRSLSSEYLHVGLPDQNYAYPANILTTPRTLRANEDLVRIGLQYRFN